MGGGGFGGPAVLGRGLGSNTGQRTNGEMGIGFFAGVTGTYDSGLTGLRLDADGNLESRAARGVDGFAGVYGQRKFRRGTVGINYSGHYRQYTGTGVGNFNGTDQTLGVYATRQVTRRSQASVFVSASTTNRPFGMTFLGGGIDPLAGSLVGPSSEVFDNRIYQASTGGEFLFQKSARLSVAVTGNGFIVRRMGNLLFGVNGSQAGANVAYRLSRRQTVSFGYQFFTYNFTRNFGDTYGNGAFAGYAAQLGKKAQLSVQLGAFRVESLGVRRAEVDPVIAALIGITTVNEVFHSVAYMPNAQLSLNYRFNRYNSMTLHSGIQANPGNGVINTARNTYVGAGYNYSGIRDWGLGGVVTYNRLASMIGTNQVFETFQASANVSRRVSESLYLTMMFGNRRFLSTETSAFRRNSYFVSAGLVWSPNQIPVSIR